jgi:hypothetical protein
MRIRIPILAVALIAAWGQQSKKTEKTDAEIKQEIVKASIASYRGSCPCPYNVDRATGAVALAVLIVVPAERRQSATKRM